MQYRYLPPVTWDFAITVWILLIKYPEMATRWASSQILGTCFDHAQAYLLNTYILIHIPVCCDILHCQSFSNLNRSIISSMSELYISLTLISLTACQNLSSAGHTVSYNTVTERGLWKRSGNSLSPVSQRRYYYYLVPRHSKYKKSDEHQCLLMIS